MKTFLDLPIKRKLMLLAMLTSCVALLVACAAFIAYEQLAFRQSMVRDLSMIAQMTGANSTAGLVFNDPSSVEQTLKSLSVHPRITLACIYDKDGQIIATYERDDVKGRRSPPLSRPDKDVFLADRLDLYHSIVMGSEKLGIIYISCDLREESERLRRYAWIGSAVLLTTSLMAFLLSSRLQGFVSEPVYHLAQTVARVAREGNYSIRAVKRGNDELGTLIDGFNEMLGQIERQDCALQDSRANLEIRVKERTQELQLEIEERKQAEAKLAETHQQLVTASRQAGMAEVATGVLHNVGNVLNSVNVAATWIEEHLRDSHIADLKRITGIFANHREDLETYLTKDPKGKRLPLFLDQLTGRLEEENKALRKEMASVRKNIEHIKEIVAMQQNYAKVSGLIERLNALELVEDALRMNSAALARHDITLFKEYTEIPPIDTDKHKVLQILVNLVRNAKYACNESGRPNKHLTIRVRQSAESVRIAVIDNGIGIPPENLTSIFRHGFTTKKDGHGFGLHSGALAARELGGALVAESAGIGRGATFTLELPLNRKAL